jgi:1-acyl-sn-glycerol-3-phosphate acyltransferase
VTPFYRRFCIFQRAVFRPLYGFEVIGRELFPAQGRAIVVSNHISWMDPLVLGAALEERQIYFMAKKELFEKPFVGKFIQRLDAFPVDRGGSDRKALRRALELLEEEKVVGIYPEGTRTESGEMQPWQPGVALIASKSKAPLVPVAIFETREIFEGRRGFPTGRPLRVVFGEPIPTTGRGQEILARGFQAVAELLKKGDPSGRIRS